MDDLIKELTEEKFVMLINGLDINSGKNEEIDYGEFYDELWDFIMENVDEDTYEDMTDEDAIKMALELLENE